MAQEPLCYLCRVPKPGETDEAGVAIDTDLILVRPIVGRLMVNSASMKAMWKAQGIDADYTFGSTDGGARAKMRLRTADQRLFLIQSDHDFELPKGNLRPGVYNYALTEITMAGGGESGITSDSGN